MTHDIEQREAALRRIIVDAGDTALRFFRSRKAGEYELKGHQDILTEADTFVEKLVSEAISAAFPDDLILGEETASQPASAQRLWVVDPIDGTANFARGIPHFCVCMAWVCHGITELGAIYNPVSQELYLARRGHYALKNDQPLRCTAITDTRRAAVELGWSSRHSQNHYLQVMASLLGLGASVRRGGSGALALAWVAEGRTDGYIEIHMNAWDCLAGLLLVREAGGQTGSIPDSAEGIFNGLPVLAVAPGIADELARATGIPLAGSLPVIPETVRYPRPPMSLIVEDFPGWGMDIYIGGSGGVSDVALLAEHDIGVVINCAVNLDIDWVSTSEKGAAPHLLSHGAGPVRYYKLGLIDGEGNAPEMLHAGYQLMRSALLQQIPDKASYRNRKRGNILVNCRGGRSRSVALVALFMHLECPERFPTLDDAIALIRDRRELHPDEWFETPKPSLIRLAEHAIIRERAIAAVETCHEQ
ncbi:inositol monophosphatase family protein [Enterobacter sp. RHBSTW-00175]|uniref:inositol monophosphatase family protein n=1 Tax=Enterobacter sp. RHBSTW-00175 TaxID=2742639 RepID=UPI0015E9F17E|nr:inositol monophosphatase family protein [Enterobacter sp. RHBSTW-00175]QMR77551.1 inositol monophosphatase [Enterobacter sp. RHBSTW-00175]HDR2752063.1 inositol monophosphatase [Enterobacter asburiae]